MHDDTSPAATRLLQNPEQWLTPAGSSLRRSSQDKLPIADKVRLDHAYLQ